jgi:hypothetical protein
VDGSRFDGWTRRRFGLVTGGAAAAGLLGLFGLHEQEAGAARRNRRRKRKNRRQKCQKLGQICDASKKRLDCCNANYLCAQVSGLGPGNFCCKQAGQNCTDDNECCGRDACDNRPGGTFKCQVPFR